MREMGSNVTHFAMMAIRSPFFRHEVPPKKYINKGLSPLHARVMCLFDHLEDQFHECGVDNLYMSAKFCRDAYTHHKKVKLHGVTRKDGRGLPRYIISEGDGLQDRAVKSERNCACYHFGWR